mgnify:FL=1|jgi:hypothetical protein
MMITQVKPKRQVKELDRYLKGEIGEAIIQLTELTKPSNLPGTQKMYYTGNWAEDIIDNYTEKQAEIIFAKVEKLKKDLDFWQVKIPSFKDEDRVWSGYEYYAKKL